MTLRLPVAMSISSKRAAFTSRLVVIQSDLLSGENPLTPPKVSSAPHLIRSRQGDLLSSRTRTMVPPSGVCACAPRICSALSACQF